MKIGIVGSRRRDTEQDYKIVLNKFEELYREGDIIISGGCPKGGDRFAEKIAEKGLRDNFEDFSKSMGMQLREDDVKILQEYASRLKELYVLKKNIEKYSKINP
jgi:hypothetical protein